MKATNIVHNVLNTNKNSAYFLFLVNASLTQYLKTNAQCRNMQVYIPLETKLAKEVNRPIIEVHESGKFFCFKLHIYFQFVHVSGNFANDTNSRQLHEAIKFYGICDHTISRAIFITFSIRL